MIVKDPSVESMCNLTSAPVLLDHHAARTGNTLVLVFLCTVVLTYDNRQHFVCVIKMKGQGFKWKSMVFRRRATAFAVRRDIDQPFLVILVEL